MIPYVQRSLYLFPELRKATKCDLSSDEVRKEVYHIGTQHYLEKIYKAQLILSPMYPV